MEIDFSYKMKKNKTLNFAAKNSSEYLGKAAALMSRKLSPEREQEGLFSLLRIAYL